MRGGGQIRGRAHKSNLLVGGFVVKLASFFLTGERGLGLTRIGLSLVVRKVTR